MTIIPDGMTTRDFMEVCRDAMVTADVILPGRWNKKRRTVRDFVEEVSTETGVPVAAILSKNRTRKFCVPRQEVFLRAHEYGLSLSHIGRVFDRDHTTILHGIRAARKRIEEWSDE